MPDLPDRLQRFVHDVCTVFPTISGRIRDYVDQNAKDGPRYARSAEKVFATADALRARRGWSESDLLDHYADFVIGYLREQERFLESGVFSNSGRTFEDIKAEVYDDEDHMTSYMVGLLISYVIFPHHYAQYRFYLDEFLPRLAQDALCAEFGCGHGLFLEETLRHGPRRFVEGYDISGAAISLASDVLAVSGADSSRYRLSLENVVERGLPAAAYDGMTAAGLLEHLPKPREFLQAARASLRDDGLFFVMLPVNTAHIDHMILFDEPAECQALMREGGFDAVCERIVPTEDLPSDELKARKTPIVYLGVFRKSAATALL